MLRRRAPLAVRPTHAAPGRHRMPPAVSAMPPEVRLHFGGCRVTIACADEDLAARLRSDFSWFVEPRGEVSRRIDIAATLGDPDWKRIRGRFLFRHFRGNVHGWGDSRWVRYRESLVFYDARADRGEVVSSDPELLYNYVYYLVIAKAGEVLDGAGLHRLHALGVLLDGRTALFSMPVSGGKTTLALALLGLPGVSLYSEDTPLVDRAGRMWPFPVRLSLRHDPGEAIPPHWVRRKHDPIFGEKLLVDVAFWGLDRVAAEPRGVDFIFWGEKGAAAPALERLGALASLVRVLRGVVVGEDCPQRAEILLRLSPRGLAMMVGLAIGRMRAAWAVWRRARCYRFRMAPDVAANVAFVRDFLNATPTPARRPRDAERKPTTP